MSSGLPSLFKGIIEALDGHQVDSVFHEGLVGITDKDLLSHCLKEERVLITLDNDFSNVAMYPKGSHHGIILLKSKTQGKIAAKKLFNKFLEKCDIEICEGKLIIIEPFKIKIR